MVICEPGQARVNRQRRGYFGLGTLTIFLGCLLVLTGCNTGSITDGIRPQTNLQTQQQPLSPAPTNEAAPAAQEQQNTQQASLKPISPVTFLPVTGAPQSTVTTLASSIRSAAKQDNVPIVVSADQGARYQVKGYFSALSEGNNTLLVYVWDVLDVNGNRVHRISGQERAGRSSGDPWASIDEGVIDRVAKITIADLRSWMSTRG
ncbi:MAG: hypothetical protein ACR2O0_05240 [Rhizobiaceae bacterium]